MNSPALPGVGERKGYIGGSDVAGILSLSPWTSPFKVFAQKVGVEVAEAPDPVRDEKFKFGHLLEETVALEFARRNKLTIRKSDPSFVRHPKHPFMAGHPDFLVVETNALVECKNVEYFAGEWQEPNPVDEDSATLVPLYYLTQCDHYMAILDSPYAFLVVLFGGCKLLAYRINRSAAREALLIRAEVLFNERIVNDDPPPFSGADDLVAALRAGYIEGYDAARAKAEHVKLEIDEVGFKLIEEIGLARIREKRAKEKYFTARKALIEHLKGRTGYLFKGKDKIGSLLMQERENFDEFSFALAHPDIKAQFTKKIPTGPTLRLAKDQEERLDSTIPGDSENDRTTTSTTD